MLEKVKSLKKNPKALGTMIWNKTLALYFWKGQGLHNFKADGQLGKSDQTEPTYLGGGISSLPQQTNQLRN